MKKIHLATLALLTAFSISICSCGPNDNKGSMDDKNSGGEGAVDSTKIPKFDSSNSSDSSHAYLSDPDCATPSINTAEIKLVYFKKQKGSI